MNVTPGYRARLVRDYKAAYEAANGKKAPDVSWASGWFTLHCDGYSPKLRRQKLEHMRDMLRLRSALPSTECGMERPSTSAMHDLIRAIIEDDAKYDAITNTWDTSKAATAIIAAFDGEPTTLSLQDGGDK